MNVAGALGAPSLPKITSAKTSADPEAGSPAPQARPVRNAAEFRKPAPKTELPSAPRERATSARPSRQGPGPVAVAGKPTTSAPVRGGRSADAAGRILEAAVQLRPGAAARLRIALHPESLGELVIELSMQGGVLRGTVLAESEAARELIAADLGRLRSDLGRKGIRVGKLDVIVAGAGPLPEIDGPRSLRLHLVDLWA